MTGLMYCLVRGGGGCEIRTREGVAPNTLSNNAHQRSPMAATVHDLPEHGGAVAG
jgi:hypothetical protein